MSETDEEKIARYEEEQLAWSAERARLASRPWWRKASDGVRDFSERYRWAIGITFASVAITIAIAIGALGLAWLTH